MIEVLEPLKNKKPTALLKLIINIITKVIQDY